MQRRKNERRTVVCEARIEGRNFNGMPRGHRGGLRFNCKVTPSATPRPSTKRTTTNQLEENRSQEGSQPPGHPGASEALKFLPPGEEKSESYEKLLFRAAGGWVRPSIGGPGQISRVP